MNKHTLDKLEFSRIAELLSTFARSSLGRQLALRTRPITTRKTIRLWLDQVHEMTTLAKHLPLPPFGGVSDIRPAVRAAVLPNKLEPEVLALVADTLAATHAVRAWIDRLPESAPTLRHLGQRVGDFLPIAEKIRDAVDARGRIVDTASPRLTKIRDAIQRAHDEIHRVFERILHNAALTRFLQYPNATFHNDRMVVPLKAEHRGRIPGIIHRSSDTGATLFIEPADAVELNNQVIRLRYEEHEEIGRILWELTQLVQLNAEAILRTVDALAVLDLIVAKQQMARALDMRCAAISDDGRLQLRAARHPVLLTLSWDLGLDASVAHRTPDPVVPIDVRLGDDFDMLVITGPNTGGKTVSLKTVGLLAAMHQAGMPIPADAGSSLPVYDDVLIDVGDEQSLQQSLSTFSSHLTNILDMLRRASPRTLVLIDELGAGTDPEEGAAIGRAVVAELLRLRTAAILTTHLGALKTLAYSLPRVQNASVEFDVESLRPTYVLRIGEAGNSNALAIARRLGMPDRLLAEAEASLSDGYKAFRQALEHTAVSRREAEDARRDAERRELEAAEARRRLDEQTADLLRRQQEFDRWRQRISTLRPGDRVHVKSFDSDGRIVRMQLHRQQAVVAIRSIEVEVPLVEIVPHAD